MIPEEKDHDAVDGCVCDLEHDSHTEDHELPPARGGVEGSTEGESRADTQEASIVKTLADVARSLNAIGDVLGYMLKMQIAALDPEQTLQAKHIFDAMAERDGRPS